MATRLVTEIEWHMQPLLSHLLRWKCFEGLRCDNWLSVTTEHRIWIGGVLEDAPSLKATLPEMIERLWLNVTLELHKSMGLNFDLMPTKCPWTVDEVLTVGLLTK
ncbi:putative membrane protein (plasmid) [Caballeronia cordobensis]|nr:putative membrane protein [Burkholderia sp. RPE67]